MSTIFVYADKTQLSGEIMALVRELGHDISAICFDESQASRLTECGADNVYVIKGKSDWPESYSAAIAKLLKENNAAGFFAGATVRGRDIAAQVAAHMEAALLSDVSAVAFADGAFKAERMMYGGATVVSVDVAGFAVMTVQAGQYESGKGNSGKGNIITVESESDARVILVKTEPVVKEGVDISKAERIVCVGMGFDKKEDLKLAEDLAEAMNAEVACTRCIADDRGWMSPDLYIGISGANVKPDLYLALGVSGQIQHTFGCRDSKIIVGVNSNEKANIFNVADYGIVGDLYEIAPLLAEAVRK